MFYSVYCFDWSVLAVAALPDAMVVEWKRNKGKGMVGDRFFGKWAGTADV